MKIHPAVHITWISPLLWWLTRLTVVSDWLEKAYDKTAWLRDLLRWEHKKKKKSKRRKKR